MSTKNPNSEAAERTAAEWFVELDARAAEPATEAAFADWLDSDPRHEAELERCEAAVLLAKKLGEEIRLGLAYGEAARLAETRRTTLAERIRGWYARPALAWSAAALSLAAAVLAIGYRDGAVEPGSSEAGLSADAGNAADRDVIAIDFGALDFQSIEPAVVLPGEIVVDARSIAVLPFVGVEAAEGANVEQTPRIASALHDEVLRQLSTIPGIYVVSRQFVLPYAGQGLTPEEVAAQLGVRGIVEARVTLSEGRVRVLLWLTDAASDMLLLQDAFERPVDELTAMRTDIVTQIAVALAGSDDPPALAFSNSPQGDLR